MHLNRKHKKKYEIYMHFVDLVVLISREKQDNVTVSISFCSTADILRNRSPHL